MLAILLLAASGSSDARDDSPTLAAEMRDRILVIAPEVTLEIGDALTLRRGGNADAEQINLDRVAVFCARNDAAACEAQKQRFVAGTAELLTRDDYAVTAQRLRVVVRNAEYAREANAALGVGDAGPLVTASVAPGLTLILAADFPRTTRLINTHDLEPLKLDVAKAIALGTDAVLAAMPPLPDRAALQAGPIELRGNDYGASYLLATAHWESVAKGWPGLLWIAVPADEHVIVGHTANGTTLGDVKRYVADAFDHAPRGISPTVFYWTGDSWAPLD